MFLAVKEIRHEKLRYGLIISMIVLIGYLMFMLMGMMLEPVADRQAGSA